jgi:ssDNA-binding Zn-finger/Zn-ribbon topoisomerase 1
MYTRNFVKPTKSKVLILKNELNQYFDKNGYLSWSKKKKRYLILGTNSPKDGLVICPECKIGKLIVIRSNITKKRFIGCSNYYNGCKASMPLLQKAMLRTTKSQCIKCNWPVMLYRYSKRQKWIRKCTNIKCKNIESKF